ncbi:MAG: hypothetical protein APF84_08525 [Gracilibacter sp. BRH_c7a]|nr:MAG: hypothetical protein APF84_08525 [Gracilibacter sp. BRH_c7a]
MKDKLFNLILPLWIIILIPPFIFLVLFANLIIDGLVIYLTLLFSKISIEKRNLIILILKAWIFGFVADLIGIVNLILIQDFFNVNAFYAFGSGVDTFAFMFSILFAGLLIGLFNYYLARKLVDEKVARRIGLSMGIITAPWIFLIPSPLM